MPAFVLAGSLIALMGTIVSAAPVGVRFLEGAAHGFLLLRDERGQALADGDWWQVPEGDRVEINLRFRFHDGSLSQETLVITQRRVFTLQAYRLVQRGPSFPVQLEASLDRQSRRYTVRHRDKPDSPEQVENGELELPDDLYGSGMLAVLLRNIGPTEGFTAQTVVFMPKPRLVTITARPAGQETYTLSDGARTSRRYVVHPELGGVLGVVAPLVGKSPSDLQYWMAGEPVATFVRFEGPLYPNGPAWRVDFVGPRWGR